MIDSIKSKCIAHQEAGKVAAECRAQAGVASGKWRDLRDELTTECEAQLNAVLHEFGLHAIVAVETLMKPVADDVTKAA